MSAESNSEKDLGELIFEANDEVTLTDSKLFEQIDLPKNVEAALKVIAQETGKGYGDLVKTLLVRALDEAEVQNGGSEMWVVDPDGSLNVWGEVLGDDPESSSQEGVAFAISDEVVDKIRSITGKVGQDWRVAVERIIQMGIDLAKLYPELLLDSSPPDQDRLPGLTDENE